jgi:hypothetical protein
LLAAACRAASRTRSRCCGVAAVEAGLHDTITQEEAAMQRHAADMAEYVATHEAAVQRARDHLQQVWGVATTSLTQLHCSAKREMAHVV